MDESISLWFQFFLPSLLAASRSLREGSVVVDEPDACLLGALLERDHVGGVGHDRGGTVLHEDHLLEVVGPFELVQHLQLREIVAEVLRDAEVIDVRAADHFIDYVFLEPTLRMRHVWLAGLQGPEPVGVAQVALPDRQRRDATGTLDEREYLLDQWVQHDAVGLEFTVGFEQPDGTLAGRLQVIPILDGAERQIGILHVARVNGGTIARVEAGGLEHSTVAVDQLQHRRLASRQVEALTLLVLPTSGVRDVVRWVTVGRSNDAGVVVYHRSVQQTYRCPEYDVVSSFDR